MEQPISYRPSRTATRERPGRVVVVTRPSDAARRQLTRWVRRAEAFIAENPAGSLGVALTLGVILGWIIKRR